VAWRDPEWNSVASRVLRAELTKARDEVTRLRRENALMRRWIAEHRTSRTARAAGADDG
jgi:hypothetical protein